MPSIQGPERESALFAGCARPPRLEAIDLFAFSGSLPPRFALGRSLAAQIDFSQLNATAAMSSQPSSSSSQWLWFGISWKVACLP